MLQACSQRPLDQVDAARWGRDAKSVVTLRSARVPHAAVGSRQQGVDLRDSVIELGFVVTGVCRSVGPASCRTA